MRLFILTVSLWALAYAKPEMYKEKEDFQYSRSSSDDGSKSGYYGAQRGNMGGNYEKAHHMDSLAQHQMSTLVRQVDGELGEGANTRTGSVFTAGNSRGIYGSGNYDLSNLKGRSFDEGVTYGDTHSSSSLSQNSDYYGSLHSGANSARFTSSQLRRSGHSSGYDAAALASQYAQSNDQQAESQYQGSSNYEYGKQGASQYKYYSRGGSQASGNYDVSNTDLQSGSNYDANIRSRLISTTPVRVYIRPGTRVAIPVGAQTYDASHSSLSQDQSAVNSEAEILNSSHRINVVKPVNNAKHYESSYSYRKEWEKHDAQPNTVLPTENPFPINSELYDDTQLVQASRQQYQSELDSTNAQSSNTNSIRSSNYNNAYSSGFNANSRTAGSNRMRFVSQMQNSGADSASNAYDVDSHNTGSGASANLNSLVDANSRPKSYQSAYSYHKSWERRGDPYVIKPVGGDLTSQTSQRLTAESTNQGVQSYSHYGSQYNQHKSQDDCEEDHRRKRRSYDATQYQQYMFQPNQDIYEGQQASNQQSMDSWAELGQQVGQNQIGKLDLGQQSQNTWDNLENFGQQTQDKAEKLEDLGQQSQNTWDNLENFGQQTQDKAEKLEDLGQQTQNTWGNLDNFGQQTQDQAEKLEDLGQQNQNTWSNLGNFGQQTQDQTGRLEDLGQQTQNTWGNLENFSQQTQNELNENNWHKVDQETRNTEGQVQTSNIEEIEQQNQNIVDFLKNMQDYNKQWSNINNNTSIHQQTQVSFNQENTNPLRETQSQWDQESHNQEDLHQDVTNNAEQNLWDAVDKLIADSEKHDNVHETTNLEKLNTDGQFMETTTEYMFHQINGTTTTEKMFINSKLTISGGKNDKIDLQDSITSSITDKPSDIGRGDIGPDDLPNEKSDENAESGILHEIPLDKKSLNLTHPVVLDVTGLEQPHNLITTSTPKYQEQDNFDLHQGSDMIEQQNWEQQFENLHHTSNWADQTVVDFSQQAHIPEVNNFEQQFTNFGLTNNWADQFIADFGKQANCEEDLNKNIQQSTQKQIFEQHFDNLQHANNWHDQSLVNFDQYYQIPKENKNENIQQSSQEQNFEQQFDNLQQANNWHDQSLVNIDQYYQIPKENKNENIQQSSQEQNFEQQFDNLQQANNWHDQSLVNIDQYYQIPKENKNENIKQSTPEENFEQQYENFQQANNWIDQTLLNFGQQPQIPKESMNENIQQSSQSNLDQFEISEDTNIQKHYSNDQQSISQSVSRLETLPKEEKLQANNKTDLNDNKQEQNNILTGSKNVESSETKSENKPEQPIEVDTDKPGFWKSIWSKTVNAKEKVVSWFKN